ncbi:MAG: very short patch repair endonuclease [Mollicutes bacterium]|nr:very short patch repair endonuclease [Mollicutes bacterium]MDY4782083.1 very short patch repair endonuclease [Candidatus Enterosoma sp.]
MKKTKEEVHYNRSRIKGKNTKIELILRKALYKEGYRYRKNRPGLPGHPDIVLCKYKIAIFCDGDFFHGYDVSKTLPSLKTNPGYWENKILKNRERDEKQNEELVSLGYVVLRFWEHEIIRNLPSVLDEIGLAVLKQSESL